MNAHKNARLTPSGRVLLVARVLGGWKIGAACEAGGVSVRTGYTSSEPSFWRFEKGWSLTLTGLPQTEPPKSNRMRISGAGRGRSCRHAAGRGAWN